MLHNKIKLPENECPYCKHKISATSNLADDGAKPKGDDFTICLYCAGGLVFNEDLSIRVPTKQEELLMKHHKEFQAVQQAAQMRLMKNNLVHLTPKLSNDEIHEQLTKLDPNSWEASCNCCSTYYTGVFATPHEKTDFNCPKCGYGRNGIGSPAGGMNLMYKLDI